MTSRGRKRARGRRKGEDAASREEVLAAARAIFAARGFRGATMREIARRAAVDPALLHYFFGSKQKLFAAATEIPSERKGLRDALGDTPGSRGQRLARLHLEQLFTEDAGAVAALIRAAIADPASIPLLRARFERTIVADAAERIATKDAALRAEIAGAWMVGLFVVRHVVRLEPLASASADDIIARIGPALDVVLDAGRRPARKKVRRR